MAAPGSRIKALGVVALLVGSVAVGGLLAVTRPWQGTPACAVVPDHPEWSVARRWNEALLDAIRRDLPAPTIHARNLFHAAVAMWDAWAAYEPGASGYLVTDKVDASDRAAARNEAISYAAYRVLESRYANAVGNVDSITEFNDVMRSLCYSIDVSTADGDSPAALGNRIAQAVLAYGLADGSNEAEGYSDPDYMPVNEPLVVARPGTTMIDPNRWQPLQLEKMISQNGIPVANGNQEFIDPHWGAVAGFALSEPAAPALPMDPGAPPRLGESDQAFKDDAVAVLRYSSLLDPASDVTIDISPGALGGSSLGTNDGKGHDVNPVTGRAYEPDVVAHADFGRALAEFWADGPKSETPPGHWNAIANEVSDALGGELRIGGDGPVVDRLEWDVKLYLALDGANHDAAVAAWGAKKYFDTARPISMIRYMGGLGQSSDPGGPAYHRDGLPLVRGLIEVVTDASSAPGARHAGFAAHVGEIAVLAWAGNPADPATDTSGVAWIRAVDWVPYMPSTFVTPAFAGYISGHSTFSRASAEVMTAFTGSEYFPGGLMEWTVEAGAFKVEAGPAADVTLQWATYADAADQAGLARLYGGIHIPADDFAGRQVGAACGRGAWERARAYYAGLAS